MNNSKNELDHIFNQLARVLSAEHEDGFSNGFIYGLRYSKKNSINDLSSDNIGIIKEEYNKFKEDFEKLTRGENK